MPNSKKNRPLIVFLFISIPVFIVAIFAAEMALRVWWDDKPVANPGAPSDAWFKRYVKWNKFGFRGFAPDAPKAPGTYRIVAIGDSITFGKGIERESDRFPELLSDMLSKKTGTPVEAIDMGFPASNTASEYKQLKNGMAFQPDVVTLGYCYNDPESLSQQKEVFATFRQAGFMRLLVFNSYLAYFSREFFIKNEVNDFSNRYYHTVNSPDAPNTPEFREALASIVNLCKVNNVSFVVVIFPTLYGLEKNPYEFQDAEDLITTELKKLDAPYVSLLPLLKGRDSRRYWASPFDSHPNESVHKMAATGLSPIVEPMLKK